MKNKLTTYLGALVCGMMLIATASCEKMNLGENHSSVDDWDANVVVSISQFEQTPFPARTRGETSEFCKRLNFIVYNSAGERKDEKDQTLDDNQFGQAKFALPLGEYRMVILAHSANGNPSVNKDYKINFTNAKGYTDTFFASQKLTVGEDTIHLNMNMKRIVAKVKFIPEDAVPTKADSIRFYYEGGSGTLDAIGGWGVVKSKQIVWIDRSEFEAPFEIYTIPREDSDNLEVTVSSYQGTDLLSSKVIENIPIRRNCITTCRGNMFDGKVTKVQFDITIDDQWDDPINYRF